MSTITKELILTVTYEPNGTPSDALDSQLLAVASHASAIGMLSGSLDAEVETWDSSVRDVPNESEPLTQAEIATLRGLRGRGFAVVLFNPTELRGADLEQIEGLMIERGNIAIESLATEPEPDDEADNTPE